MPSRTQNPKPSFCAKRCRRKVILSAYACAPDHGSEPEVGWAFAKAMAVYHDVWVLTRTANRVRIEAELSRRPVSGLQFIYYDPPEWFEWGQHGGLRMQLHAYCWQLLAISKARRFHREIGFDLCHHVTFAKYWAPSCLAWLKIPFVWGPVGGAEQTPRGLFRMLSRSERFLERLKLIASRMGERDPFVRRTARRAAVAFASTQDTAARLEKMGARDVRVLTQAGIPSEQIKTGPVSAPVLRFISIGRLIHWKGFLLGLKAFKRSELKEAEYWVVGDGPCRKEMELYAAEHGLNVNFFGSLSHAETQSLLNQADVLVHPSFHDSAGMVCLEAMAAGKPVICLHTGGPAEIVTEGCGVCASVDSPEAAIQGMAEGMCRLASDRDDRRRLGCAGQERVRSLFLWEEKAAGVSRFYDELAMPRRGASNFH